MGAITSRQNAGVEEVDVSTNHTYKYPPRCGKYFGSHFIMGGERFDTPQPESYLFGENSDLNFLGSRPTSFPYPPPQANEPTKTLKSLVNIRKESLRFVKATPEFNKAEGDGIDRDLESGKGSLFNIEFTFDCDVRCAITVYYFCIEEINSSGVSYLPRDSNMNSETFHYKRGANQLFSQTSHCFDPSRYTEEELLYNTEKEIIPIAIHCVAEEGSEEMRQSHTTIAVVEKHTDGTYILKALKQKLFVDGLCYLLQEIYGIENKNHDKMANDEETEDNGSECVICMSDVRDTLILPCRHLCLCNSCADSLRYQANNCPICRSPFRALLQIRALQKISGPIQANNSPPDCENIPSGYEAVSLIEALNGPICSCILRQPPVAAVQDMAETPDTENAVQAAEILNKGKDGIDTKKERNSTTPEFRMSVLLSRDDENKENQKSPLLADQSGYVRKSGRPQRDTVRLVNEKKDEAQDDDSEAEKLSPLLHDKEIPVPLDMAGVVEPIDDTDTEHDNHSPVPVTKLKTITRAPDPNVEDSDYYTPDEPGPIVPASSVESTPHRHCPPLSLPGTPQSHVSTRSSGDSYSSSSSTRHLLAVVQAQPERSIQT